MDSTKSSYQIEEHQKVTVMCMGDNLFAPFTFPFTLKLVTYLRMAKIEYEVESCVLPGNSHKDLPYLKVHGKCLTDTTFMIPYLNSAFSVDLNDSLDSEQKSISLAFQRLVEENLGLALMYQMWIADDKISEIFALENKAMKCIFSMMLRFKLRPNMKEIIKKHGIGCGNHKQITDAAQKDLQALSDYLGKKTFFMGEEPSEVDATVFSFVAIAMYCMSKSASGLFIQKRLSNLVAYVERMKLRYWPDWDDLCSKPVGGNKFVKAKEEAKIATMESKSLKA